jgi:hypothetical protein
MGDALRALIASVEAASGPDRELDVAVTCLLVDRKHEASRRPSNRAGRVVTRYLDNRTGTWTAAAYTASLDAALLLVPEGWQDCWTLEGRFCWLRRLTAEGVDEVQTEAATPALALTAAALRARLAMEERK